MIYVKLKVTEPHWQGSYCYWCCGSEGCPEFSSSAVPWRNTGPLSHRWWSWLPGNPLYSASSAYLTGSVTLFTLLVQVVLSTENRWSCLQISWNHTWTLFCSQQQETQVRREQGPEGLCAAAGLISINSSPRGSAAPGRAGWAVCRLWVARALWAARREALAGRFYLLCLDASQPCQAAFTL